MKRLLIALLGASAVFGQNALRLDLSGEWRFVANQDRPEFARPEFDDSAWAVVSLPVPESGLLSEGAPGWLRRSINLPAGADTRNLALTLGSVRGAYEIYVNGGRIGGVGIFESAGPFQIPRQRSFVIPPELVHGGAVLITIRLAQDVPGPSWWAYADTGPYLLTDTASAPFALGGLEMQRRQNAQAPNLVCAALFFVISLLSLLAWRGEPGRRELLWFALASLAWGEINYLGWYGLSAGELGWNPGWIFGEGGKPLLAHFAIVALGISARWAKPTLWIGWGLGVLALMSGYQREAISFFTGWASFVLILVVTQSWWHRRRNGNALTREEQLFHALLLLPGATWLSLFGPFRTGLPAQAAMGTFRIETANVSLLLLCSAILTLLVRRVAADRRERQRLSSELEAARVIQQLLLREPSLRDEALRLEAVYSPAQEVGGDFYYVLDGEVVVLGDVAGKGLKAAMLVSLLVGVLRGISERAPGAVLAALNRAVLGQMEGSFVTCCCVRFAGDGEVTLANAGQLSPYLNGEEVTVPPGLPLGVVALDAYDETVVQIPPGGVLTLVSDGVVEAANVAGDLFGFERTREISGKSANEIAEAARAWGQNDDITVVTIRRNA